MLCPYCEHEFSEVVVNHLDIIEGECPSQCDAETRVDLYCPACGKLVWAKYVATPYITREKLPEGFRIRWHDEIEEEEGVGFYYDKADYYCVEGNAFTFRLDGELVTVYVQPRGDSYA